MRTPGRTPDAAGTSVPRLSNVIWLVVPRQFHAIPFGDVATSPVPAGAKSVPEMLTREVIPT